MINNKHVGFDSFINKIRTKAKTLGIQTLVSEQSCIIPQVNLSTLIGKKLPLVSKPDGYVSRYYKFTLKHKYTIEGVMGCCVVVKDDGGLTASINYERFKLPRLMTA